MMGYRMIVGIEAAAITDVTEWKTESISFDVGEGYYSPEHGRKKITGTIEILGTAEERFAVLKMWANLAGYRLVEAGAPPIVQNMRAQVTQSSYHNQLDGSSYSQSA